ncbi:hypothetical protein DL764_009504 [Monosporascus ibericus]|uniref:Uncharacterized protein n=1 Tax=Monosporascus ibericus TaxID=155417 RepID=A0A4Q4SX36_9PEZI|nr:hypothetical protein DL764_009504 [Monosporascus ibericus]
MAAPVVHVQIRLAVEELARMKEAAEASLPEALVGQRISRVDAALAHIWILINRARRHRNTQDQLRRLSDPAGDTETPGAKSSTVGIGAIAGSIRQTMSKSTPDAVSAYLHDAAHEVSPQRLWQAFLGSRHTLVT